jgi:tetratricopeptide (TPR) repeat protein
MKLFIRRVSASLLLCFVFAGLSAVAQTQERDLAKEEKIWQELQKTAPKAVETFKAATAALDEDKYEEAVKLYNEVLKQSPKFEPALRRGGYALIATGKRAEGLKMTEQALGLNRSAENLLSYALALTELGANKYQPTQAELEQALVLSKEAMQKNPEDSDYVMAVAQFALATEQMQEFGDASKLLSRKFSNLPATHYFAGIRLANEGSFDAAEAELKQAESLGMPREVTQEMFAAIEEAKSGSNYGLWKYFYYGAYLVGAWALGLLILFVAGKILSAKTLRSIEASDPNDVTGGGQAGLRKVYKSLIGIAGIYYYLSQPVVMLLVIVGVLGMMLFFFWIGTIPVKLVFIIAVGGLITIFYMIKSLVVRPKIEDPGRALSEDEAPELWALARDVAAAIDTRPVNEIRITHATELAVYERGSMRAKMQDKAERVLIVGVAVLNDFSQNAFRAVLAHEYGHFSNRDTAGGDVAYRVNVDIMRLAESMALSGTATFYNVAFQFLRLYHFLFRRITHGATRLQEILADRVAVHQYGADAFREGLTHVIRREVEFNHIAEREINVAFTHNRALQNLYEISVQDEQVRKSLDDECSGIIKRATTEDDTHPSPQDRFKLVSRIKCKESAPIDGMVWDLFRDRESLTVEMNKLLEQRLRAVM